MARLQVGPAAENYQWLPDLLILDSKTDITTETPTQFVYRDHLGNIVTVGGSGFTYSSGTPTGGTLTSIVVKSGLGELQLTIDQASGPLKDFAQHLLDNDSFGAISQLFAGADQLFGSANPDAIGGFSDGNDFVNAGNSDDYVAGDRGSDQLDGGAGFDILSYDQSYYDTRAKDGIVLKAAKGTVKDPWGDTDHFVNFEGFWGSKLTDKMIGSSRSEEFAGLKGKDTIDGKGEWDLVDYSHDDREPGNGHRGIKADLSKGEVKDGYGNTDTIKHIEAVRGSPHNDRFTGSDKNDEFQGLAGKDKADGGKGFDSLSFGANDFNNGLHGANVDLAKSSGQVIDDGYGNTETAKKFEQVVGTRFGDTLQGDNNDNTLKGQDGNDFMAGRGGADTFVFNADPNSASNHDTIGDFNAAEGDRVALRDGAFPALTTGSGNPLGAGEFIANAGGNPTNGNQHIVYDTTTGNLFYDPDGNSSSGDKVLIATLTGHPALTAAAFEIWS